jgi:hypothetical protein
MASSAAAYSPAASSAPSPPMVSSPLPAFSLPQTPLPASSLPELPVVTTTTLPLQAALPTSNFFPTLAMAHTIRVEADNIHHHMGGAAGHEGVKLLGVA